MKPRSTPLRRSRTAIPRKTRVKSKNVQRRKESFARAYGGSDRVQFVWLQPCCVGRSDHAGPIDNVHIETGGAGRKADADKIVAMCRHHHRVLHIEGRRTFEDHFSCNLDLEARELNTRWLAFRGAQEQDA